MGQRRESYVLVSVRVVSYIWLTVKVEKERAIVKTGGLSWDKSLGPAFYVEYLYLKVMTATRGHQVGARQD